MILDSDSSQSSQTPSSLVSPRLRSSSIFVAARKHAADGEAAPDPALAVGVSQSCASPHLSTSLLSTSMWKRSSGEDPQQDQGQVQAEGENPVAGKGSQSVNQNFSFPIHSSNLKIKSLQLKICLTD